MRILLKMQKHISKIIATKSDLIKWLKKLDNKLDRPIILIAVGGTAMTLLNLKESTRDVDFCIKGEDSERFRKLIKGAKFKIDVFIDGFIFSEQLPDDYIDIANEHNEVEFKNIKLKTLNPLDIIITKAARYNERDEEDIATLTKKQDFRLIKGIPIIIYKYEKNIDFGYLINKFEKAGKIEFLGYLLNITLNIFKEYSLKNHLKDELTNIIKKISRCFTERMEYLCSRKSLIIFHR